MVNVSSTGMSGSLGTEWAIKDERRNKMAALLGEDVSFLGSAVLAGIDADKQVDAIVSEISLSEDMDLQFEKLEYNGYVESGDDVTIQNKNGKLYTNLDFENGTYNVATEKQFAASVGIEYKNEDDKPFDFIKFNNNTVQFTDLVFAGAGDGKNDKISLNIAKVNDIKWDNVYMNIQEVNVSENDVQSIIDTVPDFVLEQIKAELTNYKEGTPEYNEKFLEVAGKLMDQEDYMNKKEIADPSKTNLTQGSKSFNVVRDENGRARIILNTEEAVNVGGVGVVNGSAMISLGITNKDSNESVVQIGNKDADKELNYTATSRAVNFNIFGQNVNADFNSPVADIYNIGWQVENGSFDSSNTNAGLIYLQESGSKNNIFNLSDDNRTYTDGKGENNTRNWKGFTVK